MDPLNKPTYPVNLMKSTNYGWNLGSEAKVNFCSILKKITYNDVAYNDITYDEANRIKV